MVVLYYLLYIMVFTERCAVTNSKLLSYYQSENYAVDSCNSIASQYYTVTAVAATVAPRRRGGSGARSRRHRHRSAVWRISVGPHTRRTLSRTPVRRVPTETPLLPRTRVCRRRRRRRRTDHPQRPPPQITLKKFVVLFLFFRRFIFSPYHCCRLSSILHSS